MELFFLRAMGVILSVGCTGLLITLWFSYGIPASPEDWAACIAINMMVALLVVCGLVLAFLKD